MSWAWAVLLLLIGMALAVLEIFLPSGGILGFLAFCAIVAAVVLGFVQGGPVVGFIILAIAMFGVPLVVILALKWWPLTPMGRRMLLDPSDQDEILPDDANRRFLKELKGRVGVAKSKMLPSGAVSIDGRTISAVSEGGAIEPGQRVRVIEVHGTHVVVRPVDVETPLEADADPLSRPIDTVGPDPFDDRPA